MDIETNIYELLDIANSYKNPNIIKKILYSKKYLLEKSYDTYTQIVNILIFKKEYNKANFIYDNIINIVIDMDKDIYLITREFCKWANIKYLINKEDSVNTYMAAYYCFDKIKDTKESCKILDKIINIYEELLNYSKVIEYLIKYIEINNDINHQIKLGDYYILNDNILNATKIYSNCYKDNKLGCVYKKLILSKLCLNKDDLRAELYDSNLLYPSLDIYEDILYVENIIDIIKNKDKNKLLVIISENKDNIINILLNNIMSNL